MRSYHPKTMFIEVLFMVRSARNIRKTLDIAAENNEAAAVVVMRAAEQLEMNDLLRQQLLNVIHRLHQDADELREIRDDVLEYESKVV